MLDQLVQRAREQRVFPREDTPTEQRVEAAFLYHFGLSYRQVGEWLGHSHQAVHEWYTALADLFELEPDEHGTVVVDETKVIVDDREVYVWAAIDRHTDEVIHVEASPGRSELDALLFLRIVLERCRGRPVIVVDRGPWYNWSLDELDLPCESRRETWGDRSIVESWFSPFTLRIRRFFDRFPYRSSWQSADRWTKAFVLIHNTRC
ncbi:DDE-type integrase/transposase/recombinase [Natribaculum luteum]|uniref:DDE-type integrase/transposase/recombinase n=1 Tax=Natribaculum luteum TaxID=1586232 RepID=A0ABD5NV88_9EURY|nr:DDE-type integrase/transposase/recombinase [Natribaculum luteum]